VCVNNRDLAGVPGRLCLTIKERYAHLSISTIVEGGVRMKVHETTCGCHPHKAMANVQAAQGCRRFHLITQGVSFG